MGKNFSSGRAFVLLLFMAGLYAVSFFQRIAVPGTIFNDIQRDFAASAGEVTVLSSIYLLIYASAQLFVGVLADRNGGVKVILVSGVLLCLGTLAFPLSKSLSTLYVARALVGLGASGMYLCVIKETDALFGPKNFAPLIGLFCVIGYGGGLLGTRPFRGLVDAMGWRHASLLVAFFAVILLILVYWVGRGAPSGKRRPSVGKNALKADILVVLANAKAYPLIVAGAINFAAYFSVQSTIGPKFLEDFLKLETRQSTRYTFVMMAFTMVTMLVSGPISRVLGNKRKPFLVFGSGNALCAAALLALGTIFGLPPMCFMIAYAMLAIASGISPVMVSFVKELNPRDLAGMAVGAQNTASYIAVAISACLIGAVLDAFKSETRPVVSGVIVYPPGAYLTLFVIMAFFAGVSLVVALKCRETNGKNA